MDSLKRACAHVVLTYRKTILALLAAVTAFAFVQLQGVGFDNALEIWFLRGDPALENYRELNELFASDEVIVLGVEADDVFDPAVLEVVEKLTRAAQAAPHVEKVFSLTEIEAIRSEGDMLDISNLVDFPASAETLREARERALSDDLYRGNIVSEDGTFTAVLARIPHIGGEFDYKVEVVGALRSAMEEVKEESGDSIRFFLSGGPVLDERFYGISEEGSIRTLSTMVVFLTIVLWALQPSLAGVLLPLMTVCLATVWAVAWMALAEVRVNIITTLLPPLLLGVGVADSMHVVVDYVQRHANLSGRREALRETLEELLGPLTLTSLTTATGLISLSVSRVQGIREFGIFSAIGVIGAYVLSITLVPIILSYVKPPQPRRVLDSAKALGRLDSVHRLTVRRGPEIVGVSVLLVVVALLGASRIRAESMFLEMLPEDEAVRLDTRYIEKTMAGTLTMEILIDSGREGGIKDPAALREIAAFQEWLETLPNVTSTLAVTDYLKALRGAMFEDDPAERRLPDTREEAAQYLLLYEMDAPDGDIRELVTYDYSKTRISARVVLGSSNESAALAAATRAWAAKNISAAGSATVTGVAMLYANMEEYMRDSLLRGFSIALVAIFLILCVQLRSFSLGLIAMMPNVLPILLCLGVMGYLGIQLDSLTAMVASVAIGLAVDDSIHFISRVRSKLAEGLEMVEALADATREVGRALIYTSLTLSAGFGVMMLGRFVGMVHFGFLCMLTIIFALAADLLLLPVVLRWHGGAGALTASQSGAVDAGKDSARQV